MNFLKLLLGLLSTVFSVVILVILAISITFFLIFSNLKDVFSYENKFIENDKQSINRNFKSK
tara:strand:- start:983 stop:1168 length:186 start_codon:yes stop_codon:yes gene_type:complete